MPHQPLVDVESLLGPIEGEDPAGSRDVSIVRGQLEELRKEVDPDQFDKNDPARPDAPKRADWRGIVELTSDTLRYGTKDYLIAVRLVEALTKLQGYAGLVDGLRLLRLMTEGCWDRMHPEIAEEDDIDTRARRLDWLDEIDRGAWFPSSLRLIPLLPPEPSGLNWQQWKDSQGGKGKVTKADVEKGVQLTGRDAIEGQVNDLRRALQELDLLSAALNAKMTAGGKNYAPSLNGIRGALRDCLVLAEQVLEKKGGGKPKEKPAAEAGTPAEESKADGPAPPRMETRAEIYARIGEAADKLMQIEPHSPIPYLLHRAVDLGNLPFPELIRSLILNADVLKLLNRELGIKETPEKK
ncbi:type VI secretion system protein TssA [Aquisphaera insulae]|uniref:type VI secretion system protein TssA n=1 Tax=Aquisphaera insulae TaxID=2712864 RepID=UPI0013EA39E9|nr:type VI secretion system protein TssA [Aquisphaera insulae]